MRIARVGRLFAVLASVLVVATSLTPVRVADPGGWQVVKVVQSAFQELNLSVAGPGSAWATGEPNEYGSVSIQRWNGQAWQFIRPPGHLGALDLKSVLASVGSSSAGNAWMFPLLYQGTTLRTVALHWHRGGWTMSAFPRGAEIADTAVFSAANAWAFGTLGSGRHLTPYDLRYDGHRWRRVHMPGVPYQVSALSATNMWAVGTSAATLDAPVSQQVTLVMHWNGRAWSHLKVPVPALPRGGNLDDHFAAAGAGNLWFGYIDFTRKYNVVANGLLHWLHHHWKRLRLPDHFTSYLNCAAQDGQGGLWICSPDNLYHYSNGQWTEQIPPDTISLDSLAWIPGTHSAWAAGTSADGHGVLLRYNP